MFKWIRNIRNVLNPNLIRLHLSYEPVNSWVEFEKFNAKMDEIKAKHEAAYYKERNKELRNAERRRESDYYKHDIGNQPK